MPTTTNLALPYPSLSDAPNVPQNFQNLATAIDTTLAGAYANYTPTFYSNSLAATAISAGSVSVTYSRWQQVGKRVHFYGHTVINVVTANGFGFSLPVNVSQRIFNMGGIYLQGNGTTGYVGVGVVGNAFIPAISAPYNRIVIASDTNGSRNILLAGDAVAWNITYESV